MNAARVLKSMGASVSLVDGKLKLAGLDQLDRKTAALVLEVARARKAEIVAELTGEASASPGPALPCSSAKLPCLGEEGTCFGKPYWGGQLFTGEKDRRKASDLKECPYPEAVGRFQAKPPARPITMPTTPPETQWTRLESVNEGDPLGLRQLRDLLSQHGLNLSRTPIGQVFAWGEPPLHLEALEFVALMVREVREDLGRIMDQIPTMSESFAEGLLERLEDQHAGEGFHVLPGWRGLSVPDDWPPMVGVELQKLFLCASKGCAPMADDQKCAEMPQESTLTDFPW